MGATKELETSETEVKDKDIFGATKEPKTSETEDKDKDIFGVIGSFGPWQKRIFAVFFVVNIVGIWQNFAVTFLAPNIDFWCVSPLPPNDSFIHFIDGNASENFARSNRTANISTGWKGYKINQCNVPVFSYTKNTSEFYLHGENFTNTVPCVKWEYDTSVYSETIVREWDLVCDREWLVSLAKSVYMIGFLLSVIIFGQISDCVGRLPVIVISYMITCISLFMSLWSSSYLMFAVLRFFLAFGRTGLSTTGFVLLMELIGPLHQTEVGVTIQIGWSIGFILLPGVAYFVRHWFWFQLAASLPILPLAFTYKLIPESPRWLLMQGKTKRLERLLTQAAKKNGQELKCDIKDLNILKAPCKPEKGTKTKTIFDLFKTPRMRNRVINMIYLWIVNAFMYYGLSFNTNDLAGDPYLNFFIAGVLEIPSYVVVFYGIKRLGRRITLIALMLIGGIACGAMIPVPSNLPWLATTFAMIGKFCITGSFGILYIYTSELFPTVVRNVAIGSCSMCARFGSISAPFVRELGKATYLWVPNAVFAALAISSGLFAFLLPETKDQKLPDTLEEGEQFGKNNLQECDNQASKQ